MSKYQALRRPQSTKSLISGKDDKKVRFITSPKFSKKEQADYLSRLTYENQMRRSEFSPSDSKSYGGRNQQSAQTIQQKTLKRPQSSLHKSRSILKFQTQSSLRKQKDFIGRAARNNQLLPTSPKRAVKKKKARNFEKT